LPPPAARLSTWSVASGSPGRAGLPQIQQIFSWARTRRCIRWWSEPCPRRVVSGQALPLTVTAAAGPGLAALASGTEVDDRHDDYLGKHGCETGFGLGCGHCLIGSCVIGFCFAWPSFSLSHARAPPRSATNSRAASELAGARGATQGRSSGLRGAQRWLSASLSAHVCHVLPRHPTSADQRERRSSRQFRPERELRRM
jgi:hypothetical protein